MPLPAFIGDLGNVGAAHMLWVVVKATAILLAGLTLALALHRSSASTRYVVWLFSLAGLLALPAIAKLAPVGLPILPAAVATTDIDHPDQQPGTPRLNQGNEAPAASGSPETSLVSTDPAPGTFLWREIPLATLLPGAWGLVAVVLLGRLTLGVLSVRRIVRRAEPLTSPEWQELLYEIADRLGIDEAPALLKSGDIQMPFAAGVRRATVVLPADCEGWTADRRDAVLIHELGHVRRHDMIGHTLGRIACAVYWFHPLAWTAARKLRDASERACDDLAIQLGARPSEYAQHLLDIVTSVQQTKTPTAAIAMARRKEFEGRMLAILDPALRRDTASRWRTAALSGTLAVFVFAVSAAAPAPREAVTSTPPPVPEVAERGVPTAAPETTVAPRGAEQPVVATDDAQRDESLPSTLGQVVNEAMPILDRFIQDQARRINVNVNLFGQPGTVDPEKRDLLIRILRTDSAASVRKVAAWGLQRYATDANAQTALANALRTDTDARVRTMSAWALAHTASPAALQALRAAFSSDRDEDVRETAVWGLGTHGEQADAELIANSLTSEASKEVRSTAAWALGSIGGRSAPRSLIALLDDPDSGTRLRAAWALSQIGDSSALPAIQRALSMDQEENTTRALLRALVRSGASTEAISGLMTSPNAEVRMIAIRSISGGGLVSPWPWPWPRPIVFP